MRSCIFSIITAVFSVTWSSEIIIICWFIINVETVVLLHIVLEPVIFFFSILWLIKSSKEQHLFQKRNCVTINNAIQKFGVSTFFYVYIYFLKKLILFIHLTHPSWIKVIVNAYIVRKYLYFEQMLLFLTLYSLKNQRRNYHMFQKNNMKHNTHNKSAYYYDFWRSCDTEDCSNDAENTALITEINYILKCIKIGKQY